MPYILLDESLDDLDEIWLYGAGQWGVEQADTYHNNLLDRVILLSENPKIGRKRDDVRKGFYSFVVAEHVIFYKIENDCVVVVGFVSQSEDVERHFQS